MVFLRHRVTVETYMGASGTGPVYDEPIAVAAFVSDNWLLAADKSETSANATVIARLNQAPALVPESRITHLGRTRRITSASSRDDGNFGAWRHVSITCE